MAFVCVDWLAVVLWRVDEWDMSVHVQKHQDYQLMWRQEGVLELRFAVSCKIQGTTWTTLPIQDE